MVFGSPKMPEWLGLFKEEGAPALLFGKCLHNSSTGDLSRRNKYNDFPDSNHYFLSKFRNIEAPGTKNGISCPETEL